jgi:cytochrome bd-type quinol oxidase subunit 1
MRTVVQFFLVVVAGLVVGWFLLAGICSWPWLRFSNACGHNAFMWLPITIPIGICLSWILVARLWHKFWPRLPKKDAA